MVVEQIGGRFQITKGREKFFVADVREFKKPWRKINHLLLILDWRHAATVQSVIGLRRPQAAVAINEGELDQLIFKAFWEFLNRYRNWSAQKLGLRDADLILADIGILEVRLGGKKILNPLGFRGSDFVVRLQGTFTSRTALGWLDYLRDRLKGFSIIENGGLFYGALSKGLPAVVFCAEDRTAVFGLKSQEISFRKEVQWGYGNILQEVARIFNLDGETASDLMERYAVGEVSDRVARFFSQLWQRQFRKLGRGLGRAPAYFVFNFPLPLQEKWAQRFRQLSKEEAVASLLDNVGRPEYNYLNQMLKRRARWLIPHL